MFQKIKEFKKKNYMNDFARNTRILFISDILVVAVVVVVVTVVVVVVVVVLKIDG